VGGYIIKHFFITPIRAETQESPLFAYYFILGIGEKGEIGRKIKCKVVWEGDALASISSSLPSESAIDGTQEPPLFFCALF
jgi:hypothetical protein